MFSYGNFKRKEVIFFLESLRIFIELYKLYYLYNKVL